VALLIQTDRFGTPIAHALRVHSDTIRLKRRQRAEEAAAKTTVKLLFPLVLFIFPPLYLVILGPAIIKLTQTLSGGFYTGNSKRKQLRRRLLQQEQRQQTGSATAATTATATVAGIPYL